MKRLLLVFVSFSLACGSPPPKRSSDSDDGEPNNATTNNVQNSNSGSTNNGTSGSTNNATSGSTNNGTSGSTNNGTDGCAGCVSDDGSCRVGDAEDACGVGGAACSTCSGDEACSDGTCVARSSCGPDNCDGCCDASGECQSGEGDSACGAFGAACEACTGTESCREGLCKRPCAETCAGCCDGETCLTGSDDGACGSAGAACAACTGASTCDGGSCISTDCSTTCAGCCDGSTCLGGDEMSACGDSGNSCAACGSGQACEQGQCVADPDSRWELIVISGSVSTTDPDGESWDYFNGSPDPLVEAFMSHPVTGTVYSGTSSYVQNDSTPYWNESLIGDVPLSAFENFQMEVWDSDLDADDHICGSIVDLTSNSSDYQAILAGQTFTVSCTHPDNSSVFAEIDFRVQPF